MTEENLDNLPPEERIKKLKELEKKRQKEIEDAKKKIKESESELTERRKWFEKVPIPQVAQEDLTGLGKEGKEILEVHKGVKEKEKGEPATVEETVSEETFSGDPDLEALARERIDLPLEIMQSEYAQQLGQKPIHELYSEMKTLESDVEEKGYVSAENQRKAEYLMAGMENKLEDVEEGSYSFTEKAAMRASLIQQMGAKVTGMYQSGKSTYQSR